MHYRICSLFLLLYSFSGTPAAAQQHDCLQDYKVVLELSSDTNTFDIWDVSGPDIKSINIQLSIRNKGKKNVPIPQSPAITYEDERFFYPDIFFHIWYRGHKGRFIRFNNKDADIDPVIDPTTPDTAEVHYLKPGKTALLKRDMNPFSIHGNKGPGHYRIQAFYRSSTPCGDYITKSNFIYLKGYDNEKNRPKKVIAD